LSVFIDDAQRLGYHLLRCYNIEGRRKTSGIVRMRLVCPNCDAEYEVAEKDIPSSGRDVQCSNCGTLWFQQSLSYEGADDQYSGLIDASNDLADSPTVQTEEVRQRSIDASVLAVLREEAEREATARRKESAQPIETQTEMGLSQPTSASSVVAKRIARMKGADPESRPAPRSQTRREMLPAIEEINSTLRATSERRTANSAPDAASVPHAGWGVNSFRNGFVLMFVVAAFGVFAYAMAPRIAQQLPAIAPYITNYVELADSARVWLDELMQQAISALRGLSDVI